MVFTDAIRAIAQKELSDKLKSRWVIVIAAGFAVFTFIVAYFGGAASGVAGFRDINITIAGLTSLATYFIPLLALTLGNGIIADEYDKGTLEIYMASPISTGEFVAGKFLGLAIAITLATLFGFGSAGLFLLFSSGSAWSSSALTYGMFILNSVMLGLIFLGLSFLVSILFNKNRSRAIAFTVFLWLFFAMVYDLGLIGLLVITKGSVGNEIFSFLLLLNPVDVYRTLNFLSLGELKVFLGLASVELPAYMSVPALCGITLLWIAMPLIMSYYFFKRLFSR